MINHHKSQSGFSAVELLVTLFVAAIFLIAGHQLYTTIIRDSGASRQKARASNLAYDYLRRYAATAPTTCASSTPVDNVEEDPVPEGLVNVFTTVTYSCPQGSLTGLTKVQATVHYGTDGGEVSHAVYVSK